MDLFDTLIRNALNFIHCNNYFRIIILYANKFPNSHSCVLESITEYTT